MKALVILMTLCLPVMVMGQKRIYYPQADKDNPLTDGYKMDGWQNLTMGVAKYPLYTVVKGDSLILEFATHHWYDRVKEFAFRYVPLDSYPTDLTRGQVKAIIRRIETLEKRKP